MEIEHDKKPSNGKELDGVNGIHKGAKPSFREIVYGSGPPNGSQKQEK